MSSRGRARWRARLALGVVALASSACASLSQDVHLSPFVSHLSTAGGGREFEALAGSVVVHRPTPESDVDYWQFRPFWCHYVGDESTTHMRLTHAGVEGEVYDHFLVPLGDRNVRPDETVTRLLPIFRYQTDVDANGAPRWRLIALPGIMWSQDSTGRIVRAFFPFGGVVEDFGTYDRIDFVLWPIWMKTVRGERVSYHFLWPIFNYVDDGKGQQSGRVWPFIGAQHQGGYDRYFFLWPFFHYQHDNINAAEENQRRRWMFWPFIGHEWGTTYSAWTWLWPFFGFAHDESRGFWSWDGPWPFVRIQRPGTNTDVAYRTRFWPFYSYYEGDGLKSRWVIWPIFNQREEQYADGSRRAENVIPFWQHWEHYDLAGDNNGSWQKLWPLYQRFVDHDYSRTAFPALNPLWHTPEVDEHYAWLYELYTRTTEGESVRERAWGGLWRREKDAGETREYVTGLWSRRKWREGDTKISETSLLFGLLRWRSQKGARFQPLWPAFPGPGWPALRQG
jgi:hypothetical protein